MRHALAFAALLPLWTLAPAVGAAAVGTDWMPNAPGTRWIYQAGGGSRDTVIQQEPTTFEGLDVIENRFGESGIDAGLRQYWEVQGSGPDGVLLFHGAWRPHEDFGIHWVPPLRWMQGPPALGNEHSEVTVPILLPAHDVGDTVHFTFRVTESITLPVLGFTTAWGVGYTTLPALFRSRAGRAYTLTGRAIPTGKAGTGVIPTFEWWAPGFGEVQWNSGELWTLVQFDLPTPVANTTWGRIKRLYR